MIHEKKINAQYLTELPSENVLLKNCIELHGLLSFKIKSLMLVMNYHNGLFNYSLFIYSTTGHYLGASFYWCSYSILIALLICW